METNLLGTSNSLIQRLHSSNATAPSTLILNLCSILVTNNHEVKTNVPAEQATIIMKDKNARSKIF